MQAAVRAHGLFWCFDAVIEVAGLG